MTDGMDIIDRAMAGEPLTSAEQAWNEERRAVFGRLNAALDRDDDAGYRKHWAEYARIVLNPPPPVASESDQ